MVEEEKIESVEAPAPVPEATPVPAPETKAMDAAPEPAPEPAPAPEPIDWTTALELPEGIATDDPIFAEVTGIFGEARLDPAAAQKLMDLAFRRDAAAVQANAEAWQNTIRGWQSALKSDPDFGGAKLQETQSLAARAIDAYGGKDAPEIREFMKQYGLGDHPAFARLLARAGRSVKEDGMPRAHGGGSATFDARSLYPNSNMNP